MTDVRCEVTGSVWKLLKKAGDTVAEGEELMIIESMKMEIPVISEEAGVVAEICVAASDAVQEGQVVARIEDR